MDQLKSLLASLNLRQRLTILAVAAAVVTGLVLFSQWRRESDFRPLYASLAPEDAGAVVQKLKESGVEYRLGDNGATVLVASGRVAESRLALAAAGLPKSGRMGFELFDKNNFGATEFAEHINFHRALEGELERSIMCLSEVEQARVHITFPKDSIYTESKQPAKASVLVRLRPGVRLAAGNVAAISYLVASAVEGLGPEAVSIVDMRGNLLNRARRSAGESGDEPSEALLDFRHNVEHDLANKINATLEPLLGADKFRAGVSVECDFTATDESEEILDPTKSVMVSSQKTEDISGGTGANGVPGTASNLPRPTSRPGSMLAGMSRRTENIAYQSSRTVRHRRLPQGTVKRMSLSVLVDEAVRWEGKGAKKTRVLVPPAPETLKAIRDLVAGVTGFSPDRGDQLIVEALPFESTANPETETLGPSPAPAGPQLPAWMGPLRDPKLAGAAIGGALLVIVGALVWLALRRSKRGPIASSAPAVAAAQPAGALGPSAEEQMQARLAEQAALQEKLDMEALSQLKLPKVTTKKTDVLVKQVRENTKKDPTPGAQVLKTWISDQEKALKDY